MSYSPLSLLLALSNLLFLGLAVFLFKKNSILHQEKEKIIKDVAQADFFQNQTQELKEENAQMVLQKTELQAKVVALETKMTEETRNLNEKIKDLKEIKEELSLQFKAVSNEVLKVQGMDFKKGQEETMTQLLSPLTTQFEAFKKRMNEINESNAQDKGQMTAHLNHLFEMNQTLSEGAKELANALKGNTKHQGDWGETQLERVFEVAGFEKGINYRIQENFKDDDGNNKRPDYIVDLPNDRRLIVDCKVSLNAYTRYVNAETPEEKKQFLKEHTQALRTHIKGLCSKDYQSGIKGQGLDYVFMFIPIEHAYIEALRSDQNLYEVAYQSNIAITTASSLLPILRTIENIWRIEKQNKNVQEIAEIGGKLHDKLVGFVDDMQGIEKALEKAQMTYQDAFKKLKEGKGNAIGWASRLKQKGAKTTKEFSIASEEELLMIEE